MLTLKKLSLLEEMKDKSRNECYSFFSNYTNQQFSNGSVLLWKNENDLELNDEGRAIFCEDLNTPFDVQNSIIKLIDVKYLYLKNIKKIKFTNCVILNDIFINANESICRINFEHCFVFGKVRVQGGCEPCSIKIYMSALDCLEISNNVKNINLSQTSFGAFVLDEARILNAEFFWVNIESLQMYSSQILKLSKVQLDISIIGSFKAEENCVWERYPIDIFSSNLTEKEKKEKHVGSVNAVLDFIAKNNSIKTVSSNSKIVYLRNKIGLKSLFGRIVYILIGGMITPWVIVVWYVGLIFLFGIIYCCFFDQPFAKEVNNSFINSLYFSAVSMTTVGYGDITPVGYARIWAAIEGVIGVFLGGAFLVALTRRYFSR